MTEQVIILTRGIQGSGKTTEARKWVAEDPDWRVRINRDDLRKQIADKYWGLTRHQEENVTVLQFAQAKAAIEAKLSVIIDDTNLRAATVKEWLKFGADVGVEVSPMDLWVDLEEAIKRDAERDRVVGEKVIRDYYKRFMQKDRFPAWPTLDEAVPLGRAYVPNPDLPKAVWLDIDGTVADMTRNGRSPFDWSRVHEDDPMHHIIDLVKALRKDGYKIVVMSGRDDVAKDATVAWLNQHGVEFDDIFMRRTVEDKNRKDNLVKHDLFWTHVAHKYDVRFALDDRDQVVQFTRDVLKIPVLQVAPGNF